VPEEFIENVTASLKENIHYNDLLEQSAKEAADMANKIFLFNMAILSVSNVAEFGKLYAGGYKTARQAFSIKAGSEGLMESIKPNKLKTILGKTAGLAIVEGPFEEMMQATATT
jgi:hypothetical protein